MRATMPGHIYEVQNIDGRWGSDKDIDLAGGRGAGV